MNHPACDQFSPINFGDGLIRRPGPGSAIPVDYSITRLTTKEGTENMTEVISWIVQNPIGAVVAFVADIVIMTMSSVAGYS